MRDAGRPDRGPFLVGGVTCSGSKDMPQLGCIASKAAINHVTRSLAIELRAEYDIRVNCIMPGPTHSRLDAHLTPQMRERIGRLEPGEPLNGALRVHGLPRGDRLDGVVRAA